MHFGSGAKRSNKRELIALAAVVQPTPKQESVPQHWWENRSTTALDDEQRRLFEELIGPDGVINGKLQGLIFPIWRVRRHLAEILLLQYAQVGCPVSVGRDWNPDEVKSVVTKCPHSSKLEDDPIAQI